MFLGEHDTPVTSHGIPTTPVPRMDCTTHRKALATLKRYEHWLLDNTLRIANRLHHDHIILLYQAEKPGKFPQATRDSLCDYLGLTPKTLVVE